MMPKSASATQNVFSFFGSSSKSRPGTASGDSSQQQPPFLQQPQPNLLSKDRKPSFARKTSFTSPTRSSKKRSGSSGSVSGRGGGYVTDSSAPPALPDYALSAAARVTREGEPGSATGDGFSRIHSRGAATPTAFHTGALTSYPPTGHVWQGEAATMHKNMREIVRKRMYTLDYLRKAYVFPAQAIIQKSDGEHETNIVRAGTRAKSSGSTHSCSTSRRKAAARQP